MKRKINAHKSLMKQCGGTGKEGNIPPTSYLPDCFVNSETCRISGKKFNTNSELREHARHVHEGYVTKCWSNDALLNVSLYEQYETRLKEKFEMDADKVSVQNKKSFATKL